MKTRSLIIIMIGFFVITTLPETSLLVASDKSSVKSQAPGEKAKAPVLEKIEFIHYKKDTGKAKPQCDNDGVCEAGENSKNCPGDCPKSGEEEPTTTCYAFMGQYGKNYLKWRDLPVHYVINPNNSLLDQTFMGTAIDSGACAWDNATEADLFSLDGVESESSYNVLDNVNAVCFDDYYNDPDIIGACMVWYNPATKAIVEFDIVFETDFNWGNAGETDEEELGDINIMDLQNIATHELGHALGLADIYDAQCSDVTMFGYSSEGETKNRTLEEPDITGIQKLYGTP